jgi:hypothetical protein
VEDSFRKIAETIKLPGREREDANIPLLLSTWLSNPQNGDWLMILDSVDDVDVFYGGEANSNRSDNGPLVAFLPQTRNGSILVTTRTKDVARCLVGPEPGRLVEVERMSLTEARALLERKLGFIPDSDLADVLVQALDCVPLTISQAAAYIHSQAPMVNARSIPGHALREPRGNGSTSRAESR